jgi:putative phosphoribosyl transferase
MLDLKGRTVIVIDDGIATGGTVRAALQVVRAHEAGRVVLAVPVAPSEVVRDLVGLADEVICLEMPTPFFGVGEWYEDFAQTSDDEVATLLAATAVNGPLDAASPRRDVDQEVEVEIAIGGTTLAGRLTVPDGALGVVVFAHGSGSSRHSQRNQSVARVLNEGRLATLLFDLLTTDEEVNRGNVFDVELLAHRLTGVTRWLAAQPLVAGLPIGYFGASTGAAAALWAAGEAGSDVHAVVSRGGRPDLAAARLASVRAATLLIVGSQDQTVLELNRDAARRLRCDHQLAVIPGATHLFEEHGTLAQVAHLAREWFRHHLGSAARPAA